MTGVPVSLSPRGALARARRSRRMVVPRVWAVVPVLAMVLPPAGGVASSRPHAPAPPPQKPVPVHVVHGRRAKVPVMKPWRRPVTVWPAAGAAAVSFPAAGPGAAPARGAGAGGAGAGLLAGPGPLGTRAGALPVWAGPPVTGGAGARRAAPSRVRVAVASRAAAAAVGVKGVVFTVARADGGSGAARLHVSVSYAGFAYAYGGDYASRLRLVELPACALSTPQVAACRREAPLVSADDVLRSRVGADITVPAASSLTGLLPGSLALGGGAMSAALAGEVVSPALAGGTVVLAATASTSGSGGDYAATPLSEAGTWQAGGSSGQFNFSYPIAEPPVPGGLQPDVALKYDSQMVDGLTSSTGGQASWVGDGWDYTPGFIERTYKPCSATSASTGDLCWSSDDKTTLSLAGMTTTLVQDSSSGAWHAEADGGEKVQSLTGTTNGTHDGDYWVLTDPDGTKFYFGLNRLPGYASGDAVTNSAWTVPVYATASGQPCYNSTFSQSHCVQAWRWNLDYVTDSHGNAMADFYSKETNYYAADNGTTGTAAYTQGGVVSKIEYGLRAGSIYGVTAAGQVNFAADTSRTDVPTDLSCSSGATCNVQSPTFWIKYELTGISTQALEGSSLASVDSWALAHSYPSTGDPSTPPSLWLSSLTRTGQDGTALLPPVTFVGQPLANRVETSADLNGGYSIITRLRLTSVTEETGGVITVNYLAPSGACSGSGSFPAPDANTLLCFPDYWTPPGSSSPVLDWFNKYVVNSVTQQDTTGNAAPVQTSYSYSGAGWHYNDDALSRSKNRTWDQWRGFRTVTTQTGTSPDPVTQTKDTYFQGMNGDYQSDGTTTPVSLTSSHGDTVTDSPQFAGTCFERVSYNGAGGAVVDDTVTIPWTSAATATQSQPSPLPALQAHMTGTSESDTYTTLASGGSRESQTIDTHDSSGRVTSESDVPDTRDASEDTCTTTTYAANTSEWLLDLPSEVQVVSVPCGTTPSLPADAVSDTLTFYDGATSLTADTPTKGDVTQAQLATSYSGSTPGYTMQSEATYDSYGRVLSSTDADSRTTTTAYTPATGAEPTSQSVTDPAGLVTTTSYDPARDLPLTVTNPAGRVVTKQYDALGRLTAAWTPGHATSSPAQYTFSYDVSASAPSVITTSTLEPDGTSRLPSETLYDALGRVRETQEQTPDGNRTVTDTIYDSDGNKTLVSNPYYTTGAPSPKLVAALDSQVPSQTGYVYDGDGRVVKQIAYEFATETRETDTSYGGNYTTVVPPSGGTPQTTFMNAETTFTDGRDLTTAIYQYHSGVPADPSGPASGYDKTSYTYTPAKKLRTITDAAGNQWSYSYDLAGNQLSQADPDAGTTRSTYDAAGQLMSVTDAAGKQVSYTYDADGRKTAEYDTTGGAAETSSGQIASWVYDTLAKGQLTSATSYYQGAAFTQKVAGYNSSGLPTATETVIPSTSLTGPLAGTYIQEDYYLGATGDLQKYVDSGAGGLPQETVGYSYDGAAHPTSVTGTWGYVTNLSYTELGQPQQFTFGPSSTPAWLTNTYDQETNRLTRQQTVTGTSAITVGDVHYTYDPSGNITSEANTPSGGPSQVQCFQYDYLARLTQAWAQSSSGCASTPSQPAEGGAAPYWESFAYNTQDDQTAMTSTPPSGSAATTTFSYPAPGTARPHAVSSKATSGPSGTSTTSYGYNAAGQTTSVTGPSSAQSMAWNAAGTLASLTTTGAGAGTTSYVYDANGNLLLQADPGSVTLYLSDEQLTLDTTAGTVSGTRYYTIGGATVAARTSSGSVDYLIGDQQGTDSLAIDSGTLAATRRYYDPYGNQIGTPPSAWPGNKGFVGGTADTATGLTNLGAREYNPATAAFISPDPLLDPQAPQDLNPYAYALDNPATHSDPSGAVCTPAFCDPYPYGGAPPHRHHHHGGGGGGGGGRSYPPPPPSYGPPHGVHSPLYAPPPPAASYGPAHDVHSPLFDPPPPVKVIRTVRGLGSHRASTGSACSIAFYGRFGPAGTCTHPETGPSGGRLSKGQTSAVLFGVAAVLTVLNVLQGGLDPATDSLEAVDITAASADLGSAADDAGAASSAVRQAASDAARSCLNSFPAGALVLLAGGKRVPISEVRPGDRVVATDPYTGQTFGRRVLRTIVHRGPHAMVALTLLNGAVLAATAHHPIYDATTRTFVAADRLHVGERLLTRDGTQIRVTRVRGYHASLAAYNLEVSGIHTYYVVAGSASVLVHNSCPDDVPTEPLPRVNKWGGLEEQVSPWDRNAYAGDPIEQVHIPDPADPDVLSPNAGRAAKTLYVLARVLDIVRGWPKW